MTHAPNHLGRQLLGIQLACSGAAALVTSSSRWLLLLDDTAASAAIRLSVGGIALGTAFAVARTWVALDRYRYLLRALAMGSNAVEPTRLGELATEAGRMTFVWWLGCVVGLLGAALIARPDFLDPASAVVVSLLGLVALTAAALPLYALLRASVMGALELAPPDVMRDLTQALEEQGQSRARLERRLMLALVTPVAFVTLGSALITTAHVRHSDERQRSATALALARASFESLPGALPEGGLDEALELTRAAGFYAQWSPRAQNYRWERTTGGQLALSAPLDSGSVRVGFAGTTFRALGFEAWLAALVAIAAAAVVARLLARSLYHDIAAAKRGVDALDTRTILERHPAIVGTTHFEIVNELGHCIEQLAERFRVFAEAQERAILLREAATRMRGLFFASVSHDLKSPLNAILGFTEVIRQTEVLSDGQAESLQVIDRRGHELLALIETILDAARVEARQLQLVRDTVTIGDLMRDIIEKGRHLAGDNPVDVVGDIADGIGTIEVDRIRLSSALATFVGHAGRSVPGALVRLHIAPLDDERVGFAIEMPSPPETSHILEEQRRRGRSSIPGTHRGLALGMGLARSIIELHGGSVSMYDRGPKGLRFVIRVPARKPKVELASAPLYTSPLPPRATLTSQS